MKKKLFLLFTILAIGLSNAWAYDFGAVAPSGQTLYYNITGGNAEVTYQFYLSSPRYSNLTGALVIPASVTYNGTTYSVTSIGGSAFSGCSGLASVTIPNSVTSIGGSAFDGCSGLTSVTIPNSVTTIGYVAFGGCSGLTSIIVESGNTYYDSRNNCNAIIETGTNTLICGCMNTIIPNSVTSIGGAAFYYCDGLTSVTIPNSVTSIGSSAFENCSGLTSVTIPNSVTSIGTYAFYGCSGLTSVTIPNSVTSIGSNTFYNCSGLTSVTIPNSVTSIGNYAFYYCYGLTSVTIGNSVTTIGYGAFCGCSGLTSVTIPNSVTTIGNSAFDGIKVVNYCGSATGSPWGAFHVVCSFYEEGDFIFEDDTKTTILAYIGSATSVTIPNSVIAIGDGTFYHSSGLTSVTIPNSVTSIGNFAFSGCSSLTSVTIPDSVTSIGNYAFYGCSGLTSVTIPNSVTSIGNSAFWGCSGLTSVTIPNSVTTIGNGAFYGCSGLTSVTIPNSVTTIGNYAFEGCSGLTSVTIPNSVTSIGNSTFNGCSGLTSVTIPNSVTTIGSNAFYGCSGLTEMTVLATVPPSLGYGVFYDVDRNIPVYIPCGRTQYYLARDGWNEFNYYQEVSGAVLTVESDNELWGTAEIQQAHTCASPTAIIRANAQSGYHFVRWNDNNTDNPRTVTVTANVTYTAYFESDVPPMYSITVVSDDSAMGTVSGGGSYYEGEMITISAIANEGYHFVRWNDNDTNADRTVTVTEDATYTAYFAADQTESIDKVEQMAEVYVNGGCIVVSGAQDMNLTIYDVVGRLIVREKAIEGKQYPMPHTGVYVVRIGHYPAQKVVVIK